MSVALVERPSGLVGYLDNLERYQTTEGDVAMLANTFADERGIEGQTRLMITAASGKNLYLWRQSLAPG